MATPNVKRLELIEGWSDADPQMRLRFDFPLQAAAGTKASAVVYFEIEPGEHLGRHTDSAEETVYVVQGRAEAEVGDARIPIEEGSLALVPELVPHAIFNTGDTTFKAVGFFAAAEVEHTFDEPIQPLGIRVVHTPFVGAPA